MFAQRALHAHLHSVAAPLNFLYYLLTSPDLNTYVVAPINQLDWQILPTTKQVLLGELANRRVNFSSDDVNQLAENIVSGLTWFGRNRKQTPLTRFAGMLYELSYSKLVEAEDFNLSSYEKIYAGLTQYPDGTEIADSFEALATFLRYDKLSDLTTASDVVSGLSVNEVSIRPNLLAALTRCGEIGKEVRRYQAATTSIEQLATLARLTSSLDSLEEYVVEQVVSPEQAILRRIIRQWRHFNLSSYEKIYAGLTQYPDGTEIADSFEALARFLRYDKLSDLTTASDVVSGLSVNEVSIRPNLLAALTRCGEIGKEVRRYQAATTSIEQLATLARLTSSLDSLDEYVVEQVVSPEQAILRRIIRQWRRLVNEAVVLIDSQYNCFSRFYLHQSTQHISRIVKTK
jgi:regulator of extracellular matrix RemA (YlzA/DUF370 family)